MKSVKKISQRRERKVMSETFADGRVQPASGARAGYKSDGRVFDQFRIEHKFTSAFAHKLDIRDLWKIAGEAEGREVPVMVVEFLEPRTNKLRPNGRQVVISEAYFKRLIGDTTTDD